MACRPFTNVVVPPKNSTSAEIDKWAKDESTEYGPLCMSNHYNSKCKAFCKNNHNQKGCFKCLSNPVSCGVFVGNNDGVFKDTDQQACCPFVKEATECNACLNRYTEDALKTCLQSGLTTLEIVGIIAGVVGAIILSIIIYIVVRFRGKIKAQDSLRKQFIGNSSAQKLIDTLGSSVDASVFRTIEARERLKHNTEEKRAKDVTLQNQQSFNDDEFEM